jgi:hypothetical protein
MPLDRSADHCGTRPAYAGLTSGEAFEECQPFRARDGEPAHISERLRPEQHHGLRRQARQKDAGDDMEQIDLQWVASK